MLLNNLYTRTFLLQDALSLWTVILRFMGDQADMRGDIEPSKSHQPVSKMPYKHPPSCIALRLTFATRMDFENFVSDVGFGVSDEQAVHKVGRFSK